ncbi:MAG: polysaccharide pyruvyl transferase family protein [Candidatus Saccharimonadales bacterium]
MTKPFLRLQTAYTKNIGDEIQIIAAERFIQNNVVGVIDRERLSTYKGDQASLIMNGWYFHDPNFWPPANTITPLITSFHLTDLPSEINGENPRDVVLQKDKLDFLMKNTPIGARDLEMHEFFIKNNIPSYFSACLTLTIQPKKLAKDQTICCVDTTEEIDEYIQRLTNKKIIKLRNSDFPDDLNYDEKMKLAHDTLAAYEKADLVISNRLHAALPSLALGTPVILIHNINKDSSRYLGLKDLIRNCSEADFLDGMYKEYVTNPQPNRTYHHSIVKNLERIVQSFIEDKEISMHDYEKISSDNLRAVLWAKEANEKDMQVFTQSKRQKQDKKKTLIGFLRKAS